MKSIKAQMESLGLVVIVLLLVVGILFVVTFVILKPSSDTSAKVEAGVLATSTLNSILYTTTPCREQNIQELLIDCAGFNNIRCADMSSCQYAELMTDDLLNKTLGFQGRQHYFIVEKDTGEIVIPAIGEACPRERERAIQPLSTGFGTDITITLDVCR